ncbi:hypothetical protein OQA88_10230 [Cercophora sp. LCS_1]
MSQRTVFTTKGVVIGLLSVFPTLSTALSIPRQADSPPAIAIKLQPSFASTQKRQETLTGADLVSSLIHKALPSSLRKRDTVTTHPLYNLPESTISTLIADAKAHDPTYTPPDFSSWYQVLLPPNTTIPSLLHTLHTYPEIASCQPLINHPAQTAIDPSNDPEFPNQGYLGPSGINAIYAWSQPGGSGANQRIIDIEAGWKLDHPDLVNANITLLSGINLPGRQFGNWPHGTAVLGIMLMTDNDVGGVGIATHAKGDLVSVLRGDNPNPNNPEAILDAASRLVAGDVMLLEMQVSNDAGTEYWPAELLDAEFEAIRLATAKGIVVIEPAGNGLRGEGEGTKGVNLDSPVIRPGETEAKEWMNPASADYRGDSGAIMIGASTSTAPRRKTVWSNYGARVDVHAWGENITTSGCISDGFSCTDAYVQFGGTSGAAPIVAGAALSVQGMLEANGKQKLDSKGMRSLIKIGGTVVTDPETGNIGVMPDLKALIDGGHLK